MADQIDRAAVRNSIRTKLAGYETDRTGSTAGIQTRADVGTTGQAAKEGNDNTDETKDTE